MSAPAPVTEPLRRILAAGILAPSAENRHELRFELGADETRLVASNVAGWEEQPHRRLLALLSFAAVAENMALRAAELGLAQALRWWPDPQRPEAIAAFHWSASDAPADPLCKAIETRHTNRRFYRREPVPPSTLARLEAAAAAVPAAALRWLDAAPARRIALRAIRLAETERFRRRALHAELFGALRFDLGWRNTAAEGLPPGALEVEPPMRAPFSLLRRWPLMSALNAVGAHVALGFRAADLPCRLAPHLGLIVAGGDDEAMRTIAAGRAFERVWLAAAAEGLALQPMAAAVALAQQRPGPDWVSAATQQQLAQWLAQLSDGRQALMIFRLGRADPPSVVSQRMPLDHYLVTGRDGSIP